MREERRKEKEGRDAETISMRIVFLISAIVHIIKTV